MNYIKKIPLSELNINILPDSAFICFASFEERCYTAVQNIDINNIKKSFVIRNTDFLMKLNNADNLGIICKKMEKISIEEVSLNAPISVAEKIFSVIKEIKKNNITRLSVDITTFTHESLLILLNLLYNNRTYFESIILIYNGASEYSPWLSKGCREIRNVLGYPGLFNPSYKNHLIVLTGFEQERATRLVEMFEPDILSIGDGVDPTDKNHLKTMNDMRNKFKIWLSNLGSVNSDSFDFSCSNIEDTMNILNGIIRKEEKENYVLVPLNTKLSTISVALVALGNKKVQVVYPIPETYNLSYSKPSDSFTIINLMDISAFNK